MADFDFIRLTFDGVKTSDLNLYVVSNSGRYTAPLSPQFENRTTSVPGRPGLLYWGTDLGAQEFTISLATDGMTGTQLNLFKKTFYPGKMGELSFEESFYKYYDVILMAPPTLSFVPFESNNELIYKGEIELQMISMVPFAYSKFNLLTGEYTARAQAKESGLPQLSDFPASDGIVYHIANGEKIINRAKTTAGLNTLSLSFYHAGNGRAEVDISFKKQFTLAQANGTIGPRINWTNITIGEAKLIKPRFFLDIELTLQAVYEAANDWTASKLGVLTYLREELNGPHREELLAKVLATGTGLTYADYAALRDHLTARFFTDVDYLFKILQSSKQCELVVTVGADTYKEDNSGAFNGKFIILAPSGVLPVASGQETITSNVVLNSVEVSFKNTYI